MTALSPDTELRAALQALLVKAVANGASLESVIAALAVERLRFETLFVYETYAHINRVDSATEGAP